MVDSRLGGLSEVTFFKSFYYMFKILNNSPPRIASVLDARRTRAQLLNHPQ